MIDNSILNGESIEENTILTSSSHFQEILRSCNDHDDDNNVVNVSKKLKHNLIML